VRWQISDNSNEKSGLAQRQKKLAGTATKKESEHSNEKSNDDKQETKENDKMLREE